MMRAEMASYSAANSKDKPKAVPNAVKKSKSGKIDRNQYKVALQSIGENHQHHKSFLEDLRLRIKKGYNSTNLGKFYQSFQIFMSVFSCVQYIGLTFMQRHNPGAYHGMRVVELICALIFLCDWGLNALMSDHILNFLLTFNSTLDLVIAVSVFSTYGREPPRDSNVVEAGPVILYILFAMKTVRIVRAIRFAQLLEGIKDAVERHIAETALDISVMILFFAGLMQYIERDSQPYEYETWVYYMWVTISSVGYGDITPQTTIGRFAAMAMIGTALILIPKMTNELLDKMRLQSVYARANYQSRNKNAKHVIICGDLTSMSLHEFFEELFHEDHDSTDLNAVILVPTPPTVDIILLMRQPKYELCLTYLEGSALTENDLKRAKAESAKAIFIMTNKFSSNPDEEDAKSILLNLSIKRYLSYHNRQDMLYCTQLIRPENRRHLSKNDANELEKNDLVVCLNEIKMGAMAKAVMYHGANTLIMNLISSSSDDDNGDEHSDSWLQEYEKGCGWEIYTTHLSAVFVGAKFADLSYALYESLGVVLFALQITDFDTGISKLFLNPAEYVIPDQIKYGIEAFVIAKNKTSSDLSFAGASHAHVQDDKKQPYHRNTVAQLIKSTITDHRPETPVGNRRHSSFLSFAPTLAPKETGQDRGAALWEGLKRAAMSRRESFSYQEVLYLLEDEHFRKNFYVRPIPADLADVTIETNIIDEVPTVDNHLIVIGKGFKNLYDIIRPLRAKFLPLRHIVLVYPQQIPHEVWQRISIFDGIFVIQGSSLEESNLKRAGIFRAGQVVVLADGSAGNSSVDGKYSIGTEALVDSDAIFSYQLVKRMNSTTQVVVEIVSENNTRYLEEDQDSSEHYKGYRYSSQFASGTLFTTSLLDSVVSQTYYNPHIIKVVHKLLAGIDAVERADMVVEALAQVAERRAQESGSDAEEGGEDEGKQKPQEKPELKKAKSLLHAVTGSCLYQIALPDDLEQKNYGHLYQLLSSKGVIPLGILRGVFAHMNIGGRSNRMPYVFTNPEKETELFSCDRIFVLSASPLRMTKKNNFADWLQDLEKQKKARDSSWGDLRMSVVDNNEVTNKHINDRILKINRDVGKKLDEISILLEEALEKQQMTVRSNQHSIYSDGTKSADEQKEGDKHDVGEDNEDDGEDEYLFEEEIHGELRGVAGSPSIGGSMSLPSSPQPGSRKNSLTPALSSARKRSSPAIGTERKKSISFSDHLEEHVDSAAISNPTQEALQQIKENEALSSSNTDLSTASVAANDPIVQIANDLIVQTESNIVPDNVDYDILLAPKDELVTSSSFSARIDTFQAINTVVSADLILASEQGTSSPSSVSNCNTEVRQFDIVLPVVITNTNEQSDTGSPHSTVSDPSCSSVVPDPPTDFSNSPLNLNIVKAKLSGLNSEQLMLDSPSSPMFKMKPQPLGPSSPLVNKLRVIPTGKVEGPNLSQITRNNVASSNLSSSSSSQGRFRFRSPVHSVTNAQSVTPATESPEPPSKSKVFVPTLLFKEEDARMSGPRINSVQHYIQPNSPTQHQNPN